MAKESWKDQKPEKPELFVPGEYDRSFEKLDDALHNAIKAEYGTDNMARLKETLSDDGQRDFEERFGRMDGVIDRAEFDVHAREQVRADRIHQIHQIQNLQKEWNKVVGRLWQCKQDRAFFVQQEGAILAQPFFKKMFQLSRLREIRSLLRGTERDIALNQYRLQQYREAFGKYNYKTPNDDEPFVPPSHTYKQ